MRIDCFFFTTICPSRQGYLEWLGNASFQPLFYLSNGQSRRYEYLHPHHYPHFLSGTSLYQKDRGYLKTALAVLTFIPLFFLGILLKGSARFIDSKIVSREERVRKYVQFNKQHTLFFELGMELLSKIMIRDSSYWEEKAKHIWGGAETKAYVLQLAEEFRKAQKLFLRELSLAGNGDNATMSRLLQDQSKPFCWQFFHIVEIYRCIRFRVVVDFNYTMHSLQEGKGADPAFFAINSAEYNLRCAHNGFVKQMAPIVQHASDQRYYNWLVEDDGLKRFRFFPDTRPTPSLGASLRKTLYFHQRTIDYVVAKYLSN